MKKNLQNALLLAMGLMTTVTFAQDWNVDSRTRMDMSEAVNGEGYKSTDQRVTLGATWGGSDWGIHVSSDVNYTLGGAAASMGIYEAYASADLMGYASVTAGRQAINNGSGALMSSNDWAITRTTWDGMTFNLGLDMADITVGYASMNTGMSAAIDADTVSGTAAVASAATDDNGNMWINASGEFSGWNVNVLYMTETGMTKTGPASDNAATGIDISGEVMGAGVSASMNTDFDGDDMRVIGLSYAVNDDMGVNVSQTVYSEADLANGLNGFSMDNTNMSGGYTGSGQLGYLNAGDEDLSYGLTYNIAGISMGATMHTITNSVDANIDRSVTEISLGYSLGDNASISYTMATDNDGTVDTKYNWLTLTVTP
jgi:hypothetical protein